MLRARVEIKLKKGVVDPEGKNIEKALHLLDFTEVSGVSVSRFIEIIMDEEDKEKAARRVDEMCRKLLANPVINDYTIQVEDMHE
ncbi:MAG: phosphoribosylformylglycinamidine synthase subunit PurS [Chloroflexi bacterium]|nr:MAG: phosphoribosylformylglycinamidine synthase subunit PurS [Chloroflexota bacterium]RLF33262.1 MAG: phosphoribosylformylglycinamidine synthase subunit PurS [Thermoplasmata archaeon]